MKTIPASDLNCETLFNLFRASNQRVEIAIVYPADVDFELKEDSYVSVAYDEDRQVIVFINQSKKLLRMRTILLGKDELSSINKESKKLGFEINWNELIASENQNADKFGTLNINMFGLSLDYSIPYKEAVLEESILLSLENLIQGAKAAWILFNFEIKRIQRKAKNCLQ